MNFDDAAHLLAHYTLPGGQGWVRPAYDGRCVTNLMHSLLAHYGVTGGTRLAFDGDFAAALTGKRKVVCLLLDGLGWRNLQQASERHPGIAALTADARCWPLTTVFPSTTATVTASIMTARPPAEHGIFGFLMYFPAYHDVFNMLNLTSAIEPKRTLLAQGFAPELFVPYPTVQRRLDDAGVPAHSFVYQGYFDAGLSRIVYHDCPPYAFTTLGDLISATRDLLHGDGPRFLSLYWANLDTIAHTYGAGSEAYAIELQMVLTTMREHLLARMDDESALIVIADHGHIDGNDAEAINLMDPPWLAPLFRVIPAGEGRATHVFIKDGELTRARQLLDGIPHLRAFTQQEVVDLQLYGPQPPRPELRSRLGDLLLLPHGSARTLYPYQPRPHTAMVGRHGGLSPEEMLVPLLLWSA